VHAREPGDASHLRDHLVSPRLGGGFYDVRNLESSCKGCNTSHAARTGLMTNSVDVATIDALEDTKDNDDLG
jgi:hypothetical protein